MEPDLKVLPEPPPPWHRRLGCRIGCAVVLVFALALSYGFGSPIHWSDDIHITVTDEETGQPLPGAVAAAVWWIGSFNGPTTIIAYRAEAVSNEKGELVLDGMPLRVRPPLTWFKNSDPIIKIYKPGYRGAYLTNHPLGTFGYAGPFDVRSAKRRCYWDTKTVSLERAKTTKHLAGALDSMFSDTFHDGMPPRRFPLLWNAIIAGYEALPPDGKAEWDRMNPNPRDVVVNQKEWRW